MILAERRPDGRVRCLLCAHQCIIAEGHSGICGVRAVENGELRSLVYGRPVSACLDPIEKKPLLHFQPGTTSYSIATRGCNFKCRWCQNWSTVQVTPEYIRSPGPFVPPSALVASAQQSGASSIAYTYTEPTVFFEYAFETARLARATGMANVFVTNGYMTGQMIDMLSPYLDAANVDLKSFDDDVYRRHIGARLAPVLDNLTRLKSLGVWLEVTTLIVPDVNDERAGLEQIARFIVNELGADTPWHVSRFFPTHRMSNVPPTPITTIEAAVAIGRGEGLHHVYAGNVSGEANTYCHECGELLIRRLGYAVAMNRVRAGNECPGCSQQVAGVQMEG